MFVSKSNPYFPLRHRDSWWNTAECGGRALRGFGIGKIWTKLVLNCKVNDEYCRRYDHCCTNTGEGGGGDGDRCEPKYVGRYRITDPDSLKAAMDSAGRICLMIQAKLSPGPSLYDIRRHGDNTQLHHSKRGVVEGVDYEATGEVKKIDVSRMRERLDNDSIVILSNLGYSIATACALALEAEKLICIIDGPILDESDRLIRFLSLEDADELIRKKAKHGEVAANYVKAIGDCYGATFQNGVGFDNGNGFAIGGLERLSRSNGYLSELAAAAFVCRELFQSDGIGTMVASNLYEGIRKAKPADFPAIRRILKPLEDSGALFRWTDEKICTKCQIIASAALFSFHEDKCREVAAIAFSSEYIEKKASFIGLQRLFWVTTHTADWFMRRGFSECSIEFIPEERRKRINFPPKSKYYMKQLLPDTSGSH
ncbi:Acyl-CoA N-acyltransferase, partial [Cynara cardunculus var. scolymus]